MEGNSINSYFSSSLKDNGKIEELNVDELIDDLENKLSFVKLHNGKTLEKLDQVFDMIQITEEENDIFFLIFKKYFFV